MIFSFIVRSTVVFLVNLSHCNIFNCIVVCFELYLGWINNSMETEKTETDLKPLRRSIFIPMGARKRFDKSRSGDERQCQFLKGLSGDLRLRLLEHDSTPTLKSMTKFVQRYHAIHMDNDHAPTCTVLSAPAPPMQPLQDSINQLTVISARGFKVP